MKVYRPGQLVRVPPGSEGIQSGKVEQVVRRFCRDLIMRLPKEARDLNLIRLLACLDDLDEIWALHDDIRGRP